MLRWLSCLQWGASLALAAMLLAGVVTQPARHHQHVAAGRGLVLAVRRAAAVADHQLAAEEVRVLAGRPDRLILSNNGTVVWFYGDSSVVLYDGGLVGTSEDPPGTTPLPGETCAAARPAAAPPPAPGQRARVAGRAAGAPPLTAAP